MNDDREWLRRSLREQLERLAAPADQALACLPDGCATADELALDFNNFYRAYVDNFGDELSADARAALRAIDESLNRMSGPANAELWTDEAVATHPAWAEVRRRAARALVWATMTKDHEDGSASGSATSPVSLRDKFCGCLLGAAVGDMAGAAVEAESPGYIARTYRSIDDILSADGIPELTGPDWRVGRFTDDTQMTLCVAEWLLADESPDAERLLARFADAYEPGRRYGPGTEAILRMFPGHRAQWRALSTAMFPSGSYGNGSAMRVAPVGLAHRGDTKTAVSVAIESSRPTHSHSLAFQGAVLSLHVAPRASPRSTESSAPPN